MYKDLKAELELKSTLKISIKLLIAGLCVAMLSACSNDSGSSSPEVELAGATPTTNDVEKNENGLPDDEQANHSTIDNLSGHSSQSELAGNLVDPSPTSIPEYSDFVSGSGSASILGSSGANSISSDFSIPSYFPAGVEPLGSFSNDLVSLEKLSAVTTNQPTDEDIAQFPDFLQTFNFRSNWPMILSMFENKQFFSVGNRNFVLVTSILEDVLLAIKDKDFVEILRQRTDVISIFSSADVNLANIMNVINSVSHITILGTVELGGGAIHDTAVDSHALIIATPDPDSGKTKIISIGNNRLASHTLLELDAKDGNIIELLQLEVGKVRFSVNENGWETDGTIVGTVQFNESVAIVNNTNCGNSSNASLLVDDANVPLIVSDDGLLCRADNGEIIWNDEPSMVSGIMGFTVEAVQAGGYQYFVARGLDLVSPKVEIWVTDGSKQNTKLIYEIELDLMNVMASIDGYFTQLIVFNDQLVFQDINSGNFMIALFDKVEIFAGLPKGLKNLRVIESENSNVFFYTTDHPTETNQAGSNLWVSDGTVDGQKLLFDDVVNYTAQEIAGTIYLFAGRLNTEEIWVGPSFKGINTKLLTLSTRPTDSATLDGEAIKVDEEIVEVIEMSEEDGAISIGASDNNELVSMPATPAEEPVEDVVIETEVLPMPVNDYWYPRAPYFFSYENTILFTRSENNNYAYNHEELWQTDGTVAGTQMLYSKDSGVPVPGYDVHWQNEGNLIFSHNNEYWNLQLK